MSLRHPTNRKRPPNMALPSTALGNVLGLEVPPLRGRLQICVYVHVCVSCTRKRKRERRREREKVCKCASLLLQV